MTATVAPLAMSHSPLLRIATLTDDIDTELNGALVLTIACARLTTPD
jgi:hypothetical protein